jgi:hypothetical protein
LESTTKKRLSFLQGCKVDVTLALALIHHLALGNNIPFKNIAEMFCNITMVFDHRIIPENDEKIRLMTLHKKKFTCRVFTGKFPECF